MSQKGLNLENLEPFPLRLKPLTLLIKGQGDVKTVGKPVKTYFVS